MSQPGRADRGKEKVPDENSIKFWKRGEKLGEGGFATVYIAINTETGDVFVAKTVDASDKERKMALENERKILSRCKSPFIVQYLGWNTSKDIDARLTTYNLFMEYIQRGSVAAHIERNGGLEEPIVAAYTKEVLKGLSYLHYRHHVVHGDLKCDNLLIAPDHIKLCDLGSGKIMREGDLVLPPLPGQGRKRRIFVTGTRGWMAPEVEGEYRQDLKSDIYSLGCCVVEMCVGHPPSKSPEMYAFEDDFDDEEALLHGCTIDIPPNFSKDCRDFVEMCFAEDPDDRPDTEQLLATPWMVNAPKYPSYKPRVFKKQILPERPKTIREHVANWFGCRNALWLNNCWNCCRCYPFEPCALNCCTCRPEHHNCPKCCQCVEKPCTRGCCKCPPCTCDNPRKRRREQSLHRLSHLL